MLIKSRGLFMQDKKIDDLLWKTFVKSGGAGYYMLYKALEDEDTEDKKD